MALRPSSRTPRARKKTSIRFSPTLTQNADGRGAAAVEPTQLSGVRVRHVRPRVHHQALLHQGDRVGQQHGAGATPLSTPNRSRMLLERMGTRAATQFTTQSRGGNVCVPERGTAAAPASLEPVPTPVARLVVPRTVHAYSTSSSRPARVSPSSSAPPVLKYLPSLGGPPQAGRLAG